MKERKIAIGDIVKFSDSFSQGKGIVFNLDGEYDLMTPDGFDVSINPKIYIDNKISFVSKGIFVKSQRSDGYDFFMYSIGKKKFIRAGCRKLLSVKAALEFWHDNHAIGELYCDTDRRIQLNRESRKIVRKLSERINKKLGSPSKARVIKKAKTKRK